MGLPAELGSDRGRRCDEVLTRAVLTAALAGCADNKGGTPLLAPTVTLTVPLRGDTAVPTNRSIIAAFSEAMDPATVTAR